MPQGSSAVRPTNGLYLFYLVNAKRTILLQSITLSVGQEIHSLTLRNVKFCCRFPKNQKFDCLFNTPIRSISLDTKHLSINN